MIIEDIILFVKIKKELDILLQTIRIYSGDIGIWLRQKHHAHNEK